MTANPHILLEENKKLKNKIFSLEKQLNTLKNKTKPSSTKVIQISHELDVSNCLRNNSRLQESSIEKNSSKNSWSKIIGSDTDIFEDKNIGNGDSPSTKKSLKQTNINEKVLKQLKKLREENKYLKFQLRKDSKGPRSESKDLKRPESQKSTRGKVCEVCIKLLSKGYTTRYCPIHGLTSKIQNKSYII